MNDHLDNGIDTPYLDSTEAADDYEDQLHNLMLVVTEALKAIDDDPDVARAILKTAIEARCPHTVKGGAGDYFACIACGKKFTGDEAWGHTP